MSAEEERTNEQSDLADKVDQLAEQLNQVLAWMQAQASKEKEAPAREHFTPKARLTKEFGKTKLPFGGDSDDDCDNPVSEYA